MYDDSTPGDSRRPGRDRGRSPGIRLTYAMTALHWAAGRWPGVDGELAGLRPVVRPGAACLDIGTTSGAYTWTLSGLAGPAGGVHCFEPLPGPARWLTRSAAVLGCDNVTVHRIGIGGRGQGLPGSPAAETALRVAAAPGAAQAPTATVDDARRWLGLEKIDFIRIDAGGAEGAVLSGAFVTLLGDRPTLLLSMDPQRPAVFGLGSADVVRSLTVSLGYRMYRWQDRRWQDASGITDDCRSYLFRARQAGTGES